MPPLGLTVNDEMNLSSGLPRPAWVPVWSYLQERSRRDLQQAHAHVQSELAEQEIIGMVGEGESSGERRWELDSIPFVLESEEWHQIGAKLARRGQLLESVLQDLYGPRDLVQQAWFPQQLLFEHPGYLRSLVGRAPQRFLQFYAADLIRSEDGQWRVLADRCQAPFGLGYALQNRLVIGRSLPSLFKETQVQALAPYFTNLLQNLRNQSEQSEPRIALLGSKDLGDTNYEQAFLARYLDIDLVLADDLTVRNEKLYLKTLGGLAQLDVLLRFVDDEWCDPLNFRSDSTAGVPGLADAVCAGHVICCNALGSGVVDSPGFLPYLQACADHLGFDDLGLDSISAGWCGDHDAATTVLSERDRHVFLSSWYGLKQRPLFPNSQEDRQRIDQQLTKNSAALTAVPNMALSTAPAWSSGYLGHSAIVMRLFMSFDAKGQYYIMPGGLVRSSREHSSAYYGMRHGGISKDLWVPRFEGQRQQTAPFIRQLKESSPRQLEDLPSSRLDDLFWFGRTIESIDHLSHLLRSMVQIERALVVGERDKRVPALDAICDHYAERDSSAPAPQRLANLVHGPGVNILAQVKEIGRLVRSIRGYLSGDTWLLVQDTRREIARMELSRNSRFSVLDRLASRLLGLSNALVGTIADNMYRDHTWTFVQIGRRLQRGLMLGNVLAASESADLVATDMLTLMDLADSAVTWRSRYGREPDWNAYVQLMALSDMNPRSLAYQLAELQKLFLTLPQVDPLENPHLHLLASIKDSLTQQAFAQLEPQFQGLSDNIDHHWFSHAVAVRRVDRSQEVQ